MSEADDIFAQLSQALGFDLKRHLFSALRQEHPDGHLAACPDLLCRVRDSDLTEVNGVAWLSMTALYWCDHNEETPRVVSMMTELGDQPRPT